MPYPYDQVFAADPATPENVASNGVVTIFAPGDPDRTPLTITTLDGLPLSNPMQVNDAGFGPAFMHATLDQVAWAGGGYSGLFVSYKGMKDEAVAARRAAEAAVTEVQSPTDASVDRGILRADIPGKVAQQIADGPIMAGVVADYASSPGNAVNRAVMALLGGVSVISFGARRDAKHDDAPAIQAAINDAASRVVASQMGDSAVVYIPGGKYRINSTITQPPYVKVATQGAVIIESHVAGTAWHITPGSTDNENLYPGTLGKEQWNRGALINGASGGFILVNKLGSRTGTSGLELGSRDNFGALRHLGRYGLNDVAIQGYGVGQRLNTYNHYLGFYTNLHIETNDTNIVIGGGNLSVNAGENFNWVNCVIAGANTGIECNGDGMNCTFTNCSFDFMGRVFWLRKGYLRILLQGGHIEVINEASRKSATGGIVVSEVVTGVYPDVVISGVTPFVATERGTQFKGNMRLWAEMQYRSADYTRMRSAENWLCDDNVIVKRFQLVNYNGMPRISKMLGQLKDPVFSKETLGIDVALLANYTVVSRSNVATSVSADGPHDGARSIEYNFTGPGYLLLEAKDYVACQPGDLLQVHVSYKFSEAPHPRVSASGTFLDSNRVEIGERVQSEYTRTNVVDDEWRVNDSPRSYIAPPGAVYFRAGWTVSSSVGDGKKHKISDIHVYKN